MAVNDQREIKFDADSILHAIISYTGAAKGPELPHGTPQEVRLRPEQGDVEVAYPSGQSVALTAEPLGFLLLSYCNRVGIPLPRRTPKFIRIDADAAILVLTMSYAKSPSSWV